MPGGTVSSSALMRSTPRWTSSSPSHSCTPDQLRSISSCALTCWAHSPPPRSSGSPPSGVSSASARLCAGSVLRTIVRRPAAAHRRAVAAATDVLPTPPLPVYRAVRGDREPSHMATAPAAPSARRRIVSRTLVLAVTGVSLYLVAPTLLSVLGSWRQLENLGPGWLALMAAAQLLSL